MIVYQESSRGSPTLTSTPHGLGVAVPVWRERNLHNLVSVQAPAAAPICPSSLVSFHLVVSPALPFGTGVHPHGNYFAIRTTKIVCLQTGLALSPADDLTPSAKPDEDLPNRKLALIQPMAGQPPSMQAHVHSTSSQNTGYAWFGSLHTQLCPAAFAPMRIGASIRAYRNGQIRSVGSMTLIQMHPSSLRMHLPQLPQHSG